MPKWPSLIKKKKKLVTIWQHIPAFSPGAEMGSFIAKRKREEERKIKEANSRVGSSTFYMAQNLVHSWGSLWCDISRISSAQHGVISIASIVFAPCGSRQGRQLVVKARRGEAPDKSVQYFPCYRLLWRAKKLNSQGSFCGFPLRKLGDNAVASAAVEVILSLLARFRAVGVFYVAPLQKRNRK